MNLLNLTLFELKKLIISKSTWVLLAIFACLTNVSAFFLGGFLVINQASMFAYLKFAPVFIILFAFLISFSSNSKENKKANAIKIASLPISLAKVSIAKFIANSLIGFIFLMLTFSYIITIFYLGSPDFLLVIASTFACLLLIMLCFAVTSFTNIISRNSFESLGYSILIMAFICLMGLGAVSTMLKIVLPANIVDNLSYFSVLNAYSNISSGLVTLSDVALFVTLIIFFLLSAVIFVNKNIYKIQFGRIKVLILALTTLFINYVMFNSSVKVDLTSDKIYSISENLQNIVNKLDTKGVKVTFYYSKSNPNIPLEYRRLADYTNKYLTQLTLKSKGKIKYELKDTELKELYEVHAIQDKMLEIPLPNGDSMYAGIAIRRGTDVERIPYISSNRKHFLEYDIARSLTKFMEDSKTKKIGLLTDMDFGDSQNMPAFLREISKRYQVDIIPMTYPTFPQYDLVISFMTPFSEPASLYAADQYLVKGGKMLMLFDPFFRTAPEDDFLMPDRRADNSAFDHLADLLRYLGVEYDYNSILGDTSRAMSTNMPGIGVTNYPLWVIFSESEMNKTHPIFDNLNNIIIPEGGFFEHSDLLPSLTYTPLLTSTANSQTVSRALFNTIGDSKGVASRLKGEKKQRDVAFMLNGQFLSAFREMPESVKQWFENAESITGSKKIPDHLTLTDNEGALIAIADMDFMSDYFSTYGEKNLDGSITKKPVSDNQFFLTNTIDYLIGDYDLIALRSKGDNLRTLTKIENLIVDDIAKKEFQENALVRNIELISKQIDSLDQRANIAKTMEQYFEVTQLIAKKQEEFVAAKRKLKHYKRSIKETVEQYARKVALINILFAPTLLLILGLVFFTNRRRKSK